MHAPLMRRHPTSSPKVRILRGNGHEAYFLPPAFKHHGHPASKRTILASPYPRCVPVRPLWQIERVEERHSFHLRGIEIVGDYRNPVQCRVRLVARPGAEELDGEIQHESALCFAPNIPRQRGGLRRLA